MDYRKELEKYRLMDRDKALNELYQRHTELYKIYRKARKDVADVQYLINTLNSMK